MTASFSRRRFLTVGATAAAATWLAPKVAWAAPSPIDLPGLDRALNGPLLVPGNAGYAAAAQPFNVALGTRRPLAIAMAANAADVRTCVQRVRKHGVPIAARSGRHSYAGYSTPNNGLVIDVSALRSVTVRSDGTATIGAGARLGDVYTALAAHGRALPAGSCPSVGIAGLTLGGGLGVLMRPYGLTCDHLTSATIVAADGALTTLDTRRNPDLFWALRGGGGGNGCIVTDLTFSTVPAPQVTVFALRFPAARTARVLAAWSSWMGAAPDRLTSICSVTGAAAPTNRISGAWTGAVTGLSTQLANLIAAIGADPTSRTTQTLGYLDAMHYFAGSSDRQPFRAASRILDHTPTAATAEAVVNTVRNTSGVVLLFDSLGGQVARVGVTDTAFPHRNARASVQIYSGNAASGPTVTRIERALSPLIGHGAYVNYLNENQTDWATAYYGANLPRLRRVIKHYDPDAVFTFPQSVLRA